MGCLTFKLTPTAPPHLGISPNEGAKLTVIPNDGALLSITPKEGAFLGVTPVDGSQLKVVPTDNARLSIGAVCTVGSGTLVVLAASDGLIYTKNGGYFLLNPETNPPED
jgi:hypothetical protein